MAVIAVDVWIWSLLLPAAETRRLADVLADNERARAKRFVSSAHGDSYIAGRGRMREILATYVDMPADQLRFDYGNADKPALAGIADAPHFNLSHSGDFAALAVTARHPIGIDIEAARPLKEDIAERFFSPAEVRALRALPEPQQHAAFFRCWTRKEAFVKALGAGLNYPLSQFDVSIADDPEPDVLRIETEDAIGLACWRMINLVPAPGIAGAIALKADAPDDRTEVFFR